MPRQDMVLLQSRANSLVAMNRFWDDSDARQLDEIRQLTFGGGSEVTVFIRKYGIGAALRIARDLPLEVRRRLR